MTFYDNLLWGLFYGGLIMLGAYNLILYVSLKDNSLLTYMLYIVAIIIWQQVWGGHFHMLMPDSMSIWISLHTDLIFSALGLSSGIFAITLLNAKTNARKSMPYIAICLIAYVICLVSGVLNVFPQMWQNFLVSTIGMLAIVTYTYAGYESYSNRFYPAKYYIIGWVILASCGFAASLNIWGLVESNFFSSYCFQMGLFIQACLFSVALMDKHRHQLQLEVEQATLDLTNNIELVEEQNVRLDIARKEAVAASRVKSQFLANMSHEIRTPLNAILGFSKELQTSELTVEKQEQVSIINAAADNLLNIVNDVLDFSKIEAGKLKINNHPFSPDQMLEDVVRIMAKSAQLKDLEFIYDIQPLPEKLIGDSYRIKQILNNLLGNALKFTDSGYIYLSVSGTEKDHGIYELVLRVEDSGIGISREDQRKLFTAFSQVDGALSRSYQGTGLGLVISQELVKMMYGELTLKSSPKIGSTFTVNIRANLLNTTMSIQPDKNWQYQSVTYFDPNPMSRRCGINILKTLGANVTGVESLTFLRQTNQAPDILFISIPSYKMANLEAIIDASKEIKAKKTIILYSGAKSLVSNRMVSQQFDHVLRLPLTLGKLNAITQAPTKSPVNKLQNKLLSLPQAKVLAVDDMEMNLRLLTTWLKNTNLQLTTAYSGQDAVNFCQQQEFDLILMDVQMPNMDGLEATRLIRQTKTNLGTPIIAVTAHAFKEEQDRLLSSGMDDYLPKPINLSDLVDLIQRWCQVVEESESPLATFDWELAMNRTNNIEDAAIELLEKFIQQLPTQLNTIKQAQKTGDFIQMQNSIHQLHGACCYTGVPALHSLCGKIEGALKLNQTDVAINALSDLYLEADKVDKASKAHLASSI